MNPPSCAQPQLFKLAVEAFAVSAHYEPGEGWCLHLSSRRQGETWQQAYNVRYERMTTDELELLLESTTELLNPPYDA